MKDIILNYLSGSRPYQEGVELYEKWGNNVALKRAFRLYPESRILRMTLYEELRKLTGLNETEFNQLKRVPVKTIAESPASEPAVRRSTTTEETKRIRFRERFTFLRSSDCPEVLKLLVNDMFASYDLYRDAHNKLSSMPADAPIEEAAELAAIAVEEMLNNRIIWDELAYYQEHKQLLGVHSEVKDYLKWKEYREMSDFDLMQKRKNAASNISKYKAKIEKDTSEDDRLKHESDMREWITIKLICDHEIEIRKGK